MNTLPGFFQGAISQDFQQILAAAPAEHGEKTAFGKAAGSPQEKPKTGEYCKDDLPDKTQGPQCTMREFCKPPKKADAFLPQVPGWSSPPAPPAF